MDNLLAHHQPNAAALARAEAAGLDLEDLRQSDPQQYKMLNARHLVTADNRFVELINNVFFAAFQHHNLFQIPGDDKTTLLNFPDLTKDELKKFDDALGRLIVLAQYERHNAYYRVVNDPQGERRELALPVAPPEWQGEAGVLVGPFETQNEAEAWGDAHVQAGLVYDALPHASKWYCDIFSDS